MISCVGIHKDWVCCCLHLLCDCSRHIANTLPAVQVDGLIREGDLNKDGELDFEVDTIPQHTHHGNNLRAQHTVAAES